MTMLRRLLLLALMLGALLGGPFARPVPARAADSCFKETSFCITGVFADYWASHGGLAQFGYPLGDVHREVLEDGKEYSVQYFERARLEFDPENPAPNDVQLGQFGRRVLADAYASIRDYREYQRVIAPVAPLAGQTFFPETGHNLGGRFLDYWQGHGGLAQFGYPLTEIRRGDRLEDGQTYDTQYFERARLEYHPENPEPYQILLGQFGRQVMGENALLSGDFARIYFGNSQFRERLGAPSESAAQTQGMTQIFQRGQMIWRADKKWIYAFLGDTERGTVAQEFYLHYHFNDTFADGDPFGGGPAPTEPGAYLPRRGFYTVWREHEDLRAAIGYATRPNDFGYPMIIQEFAGGALVTSSLGEGTVVYAIFVQRATNSSSIISYERVGTIPR